MTHLALFFLGSPRIEHDGEPVNVDTRKAVALAAYLAVTGQRNSRDALAALLWPESSQARARANLRQTLLALKEAIGEEWLEIERENLAFRRDADLWVDVERLNRRLGVCHTHGHPASKVCPDCLVPLTEAVDLYRDDFMAGFALRDSPDFNGWVEHQRKQLRRELAGALERLVQGYGVQGEYETAIAYAQRWTAFDPPHEPAHRLLMQLYIQIDQRTAALGQYQRCVQILEKELGLPPQEETIKLYRAIQAEQATSPLHFHLASAHNLPHQPTPLLGREKELGEIEGLIEGAACRLLTLVGPGGIGKTHLAVQAAAERMGVFPDGIYFVSLAPLSSAETLIPTIASALGLSFHGPQDLQAQLLGHLQDKALLLVLDNFEHLLDGANLVSDILQNAPEVKVLATSRERLNLQGEWVLETQGLRFPETEEIENAQTYSAVQLFAQSAHTAHPGFRFEAEKTHVVRICQLVEGVPLALQLAAASTRTHSCTEIVREIKDNLDFLATAQQGVLERQQSLRATFDHSWNLLSAEERAIFAKLSVFRGGFYLEAAEQVAGASLMSLAGLIDKSFLHRTPSGRYEVLEVLRQYAQEKLAESPAEEERVKDLHGEYFSTWLGQQEQRLVGSEPNQALRTVDREIENVHLAWLWAAEHADLKKLTGGLESLFLFYHISGRYQEGEETFSHTLEKLWGRRDLERVKIERIAASVKARQSKLSYYLGRLDEAEKQLHECLEVFRALNDSREASYCLLELANIAHRRENSAKAHDLLDAALTQARVAQSRRLEASVLGCFGRISVSQRKYAEAAEYHRRSLALYRELDDLRAEGVILNNLGTISDNVGDYAEARDLYAQALDIVETVNYQWMMAIALSNLGFANHRLGSYVLAQVYYKRALDLLQKIGTPRLEAITLERLGLLHHQLGHNEAGREQGLQALSIARGLNDQSVQALALTLLGRTLAELGSIDEAADAYRQAQSLRLSCGQIQLAMEALSGLASISLAQGNLVLALEQVEKILSYMETNPTFDGTETPFKIFLTCIHVLRANQDSRAQAVLETAHSLLYNQAAKITNEEMRNSFLKNVTTHRKIVDEFGQSGFASNS